MNDRELNDLKTLCDIKISLNQIGDNLRLFYWGLETSTPPLTDNMLNEIIRQIEYIKDTANLSLGYIPEDIETFNQLFNKNEAK